MMAQVIMDHPGLECFGTRLAPKNRWCRRLVGKGSQAYHSLSMATKKAKPHPISRQGATLFAYADETGNTGFNLFDPAHPTFWTGRLLSSSDL